MTGSLLVPLKAVAPNLLSLTATFGALVWVFQHGHLASSFGVTVTGQLDVFTPVLMFCIAFGLSMDYELFLLARIKEEYDLTGDNTTAVVRMFKVVLRDLPRLAAAMLAALAGRLRAVGEPRLGG